jgi:hypothetical protein
MWLRALGLTLLQKLAIQPLDRDTLRVQYVTSYVMSLNALWKSYP